MGTLLDRKYKLISQDACKPLKQGASEVKAIWLHTCESQLSMSFLSTLAVLGLYISWLPCRAQDYQVLVNRDSYSGDPQNVGQNSNNLRLNCRDLSTLIDHPEYFFWLNDTQQDLRVLLTDHGAGFLQASNGLIFIITRALEGTYLCGPNQSSVSPGRKLVGKYYC